VEPVNRKPLLESQTAELSFFCSKIIPVVSMSGPTSEGV
jgi:hypothetical protein